MPPARLARKKKTKYSLFDVAAETKPAFLGISCQHLLFLPIESVARTATKFAVEQANAVREPSLRLVLGRHIAFWSPLVGNPNGVHGAAALNRGSRKVGEGAMFADTRRAGGGAIMARKALPTLSIQTMASKACLATTWQVRPAHSQTMAER